MTETEEMVILVGPADEELGIIEKLAAHRAGLLHRAFSIFLINAAGEMLLQQRADGKYHSGGLWSNACCGHPRPGETTINAARRRLGEELGIQCELTHLFHFTYSAHLEAGLAEHELDHVFVGRCSEDPVSDPEEVGDWQWIGLDRAREWLQREPEAFTAWFGPAFDRLLAPQLQT